MSVPALLRSSRYKSCIAWLCISSVASMASGGAHSAWFSARKQHGLRLRLGHLGDLLLREKPQWRSSSWQGLPTARRKYLRRRRIAFPRRPSAHACKWLSIYSQPVLLNRGELSKCLSNILVLTQHISYPPTHRLIYLSLSYQTHPPL